MKKYYLVLLVILAACQPRQKTTEQEWIQLFNGKDLTGWDIKISGYALNDNYNNTFRVEDGIMKMCYDEYQDFKGEYGHIFYKDKFSHYILRVEYRFVDEQVPGGEDWAFKNSGVMLHSQSAASMGLDQDFPVCVEAQLLGGSEQGERTTANMCSPGTHVYMHDTLVTDHCVNSSSRTYRGEEWITVEFHVYGDSIIRHVIDGQTVMEYSRPIVGGYSLPENYPVPEGTPVKEGYIALQAESHPVQYRKVELLNLEKREP
jgi:hypothetical protein